MLRPCWCFISGIFYVIAVDLRISKHQGNERSVNVALDTVLEFDNKDNVADIKFLDNVQKFIGKVKTVIEKKSMLRRNYITVHNERFTEFILNLIQILNQFNDTDLQEFFAIATDEMRKYHYQGCKFHELTANYELRILMASKLAKIKNTPVTAMRRKLETLTVKIEEEKYNTHEKDLIDYINSLYGESSTTLFHRILSNLDDYRLKSRKDMDLLNIINKGIRSVVFDYYTELNRNARMALKIKLDEYYKNIMKDSSFIDTDMKAIEVTKAANGSTTKLQYVKQYVDLKHTTAHNYGRWRSEKKRHHKKEFTARSHVAQTFKNDNRMYRVNVHTQKKKMHAEKFNKQQQQIHSKKPKTDITKDLIFRNAQAKYSKYFAVTKWYSKETFEKNDPYAYEHSKINAKVRGEIPPPFHPINSLLVNDFSNIELQSYEHKNLRSKTPKEPNIISSESQYEEVQNHRITEGKNRKHFTIQSFKPSSTPKSGHDENKKNVKTESKSSDIESKDKKPPLITSNSLALSSEQYFYGTENIKYKVNTTPKQKITPHSEKLKQNLDHTVGYNSETELRVKTSSKTPKKYVTNSYEEESPLQKLELIKKRNQEFLTNNKSVIIDHSTSPTMGPDSVEFIAFDDDDLGGIGKNLKINQDVKHKSKLPNNKTTTKTAPKKKHHKAKYHPRSKDKRLTFLTLYPEFIQTWSTKHPETSHKHRSHGKTKTTDDHRVADDAEPNNVMPPDMSVLNMAPHIPQALMKIINNSNSTIGHTTRKAVAVTSKAVDFDMSYINIAPHMPAKLKNVINSKSARIQYQHKSFKSHKKHTKKSKNKDKIFNSDSKQEKEKKTNSRESHEKKLQLNAKIHDQVPTAVNNKSSPVSSDDNISTKESMEEKPPRTFHRRRMDKTARDNLFIDVNVIPREKASKPNDLQTKFKTTINNNNYIPTTDEGVIKRMDNRDKQWTSSYKNQLRNNNNKHTNTFNSYVTDADTYKINIPKKGFIDLKYPVIAVTAGQGETNKVNKATTVAIFVNPKSLDKKVKVDHNLVYTDSGTYKDQSDTDVTKYNNDETYKIVLKNYLLDDTSRTFAENNERRYNQNNIKTTSSDISQQNLKYMNETKTKEVVERRPKFRVDGASDKELEIKTDAEILKPSVHYKSITTVLSIKNKVTTRPTIDDTNKETKAQNRDSIKDAENNTKTIVESSVTEINVRHEGESSHSQIDVTNSVTSKSVESQTPTNSTKQINVTSDKV